MVDTQNPYAAPQTESFSPGTQWLQDVSPALEKTRWGLTLVYFGIVLVLLSGLGLGFGFAIFGANPGLRAVVMSAGALGFLVGSLLLFVGPILCLSVPVESGAKGFIVSSVVLQLPGLLSSLAYQLLPALIPMPVMVFIQLLGIASFVLFVLFMRKLARYIGRDDYARRARNVLVGFATEIVLITGYATAIYAKLLPLEFLIWISIGIGALIVFVMYANLVNSLRKTLGGK